MRRHGDSPPVDLPAVGEGATQTRSVPATQSASEGAAGALNPGPSLPVLTPAGREILEVLWRQSRPLRTTDLHKAVSATFRRRAGRRINSTSTLLTELMEQGWVAGTKHGGRWKWEPSVSRAAGLRAIARRIVEEFCAERADAFYLVIEALDGLDLEDLAAGGRRPVARASGFGPGPGGRRPRKR